MDYFVDWLTRFFEKIGTWAEEREEKNRDKKE
jgi:hypothetical protein